MSKQQSFHVRMDKDLHADLKKLASDEQRSLSAQVQYILNQYVKQQKSKA